jgi:hypothetical protein
MLILYVVLWLRKSYGSLRNLEYQHFFPKCFFNVFCQWCTDDERRYWHLSKIPIVGIIKNVIILNIIHSVLKLSDTKITMYIIWIISKWTDGLCHNLIWDFKMLILYVVLWLRKSYGSLRNLEYQHFFPKCFFNVFCQWCTDDERRYWQLYSGLKLTHFN